MNDKVLAVRFGRLLAFLLAYLFFTPFIPQHSQMEMLFVQGLLSVMLVVAALSVKKNQKQRSYGIILMVVSLCCHWLGIFHMVPYSVNASLILFIFFYALLIYSFGKQFVHARYVGSGIIMGTLCLYLIIGLLWGSMYTLLQSVYGDAFGGVLLENAETSKLHIFNYFSMVTLTTLGYGDITPQIPQAASLCQMQAIVGQFFTAVLVAWMVGMYGKTINKPTHE